MGTDLGFSGPGAVLLQLGGGGLGGAADVRLGESGASVGLLPVLRPAFMDRYEVCVCLCVCVCRPLEGEGGRVGGRWSLGWIRRE
jgi:hypothetical protein